MRSYNLCVTSFFWYYIFEVHLYYTSVPPCFSLPCNTNMSCFAYSSSVDQRLDCFHFMASIEINWLEMYGFISGFLMAFHWSIFLSLCQYYTQCLDYYSYVIYFKTGKCECSNLILFFFFFWDCFGWVPYFHIKLGVSLYFHAKKKGNSWYFYKDLLNL